MYRFKTEEEFKAEGRWYRSGECPDGWVRHMNKYLGKDVPQENHRDCERSQGFSYDGCWFDSFNYTSNKLETKSGFVILPMKEFKM